MTVASPDVSVRAHKWQQHSEGAVAAAAYKEIKNTRPKFRDTTVTGSLL